MNEHKKALLHLFLTAGVNSATVYKICRGLLKQVAPHSWGEDVFQHVVLLNKLPFASLYHYSVDEMQKVFSISKKLALDICNGLKDSTLLEEELALISKHHITLLTILDEEYPVALRAIYMPPLVLYLRGELPGNKKLLAVVGARKADQYAIDVVENFVPLLVQQGWAIVSGGAKGTDTLAHKATLRQNGITIAVLGSGLLEEYPVQNKKLFQQIVTQEGVVISPFPLRYGPFRENFPARNRIISGLSVGALIIRAAQRSGSLITARFALEQGREVFAVPGNIFDTLSQGCINLIKQGATPVMSPYCILEAFGQTVKDVVTPAILHVAQDFKKNESHPILQHLSKSCSFDELLEKTTFSFDELHDMLFELQLAGKVKQNFAGSWEKNDK